MFIPDITNQIQVSINPVYNIFGNVSNLQLIVQVCYSLHRFNSKNHNFA